MPINCESFEKMIILSPGKWVCAICEPPQGASILNWPNYDLPEHIFFISSGMIGRGPLRGKNIKGGSGSVFRGVFGGYFRVFSNCSKSRWATIYFSASIHIWNLFFWLKALYPCTIPGFECHWPQLNLPFLPPKGRSQIRRFWKSVLWRGRRSMGKLPGTTRLQFSPKTNHMESPKPLQTMTNSVWGLRNPLTAPCFLTVLSKKTTRLTRPSWTLESSSLG